MTHFKLGENDLLNQILMHIHLCGFQNAVHSVSARYLDPANHSGYLP